MTTDFTQSSNPSPTLELLLRALQHEWSPATVANMAALSPAAWTALVTEAQYQRVATVLHERIIRHQLTEQMPTDVRAQLVAAHRQTSVRNLMLYHHLGQLIGALHAQAIPIILLKGAHLAATVYNDIALRHMVDADLLIPEDALAKSVELVTALGYQPLQPLAPIHLYLSQRHHLPPFLKEGGLKIELHWTITQPNQVYTIPMTDLWARAQPTTVAGFEVATLAPEDLLLHICLHATHHHLLEQGIRFLCDIDAIYRHFGPTLDWEAVVTRAQAWNWGRGVYLALRLAHELLAVPIPDDVLTTLQTDTNMAQLPVDFWGALATSHVLQTNTYSPTFAGMWHEPRLQNRMRIVWQRLFLPRDQLAMRHGVAATSPTLPLYYVLRLVALLRQYGRIIAISRQQRAATAVGLKQKAQLTAWLES